ncbi:MAG TPA: phage portal protein [Thermoguttaceae bacterium]|nr:phage portal protein [Thermoguttaceae bacterium]
MSLLDWIVTNSIENPAVPISSEEVLKVIGSSIESGSGVQLTPQKVLGHTPVWRVVNTITGDVAKLPLKILRSDGAGGWNPAKDHKGYRLIRRRPNPFMPAFRFKRTVTFHAIFRGNGYVAVLRDNAHRPWRLLILPPTPATYPVVVDGEPWFVTTINGEQRKLRGDDVIHIPGLSFDGLEGLDVFTVMTDAFGLEVAQHKHAETFFRKGTQTVGFLTAPRRLSEPELIDLRSNWTKMQAGLENMHNVGVLHGGMDFKSLGIDPAKAQLMQSREFGLTEVANIFCAPPHKAGSSARTSYNSLEMENTDYLQTTLDTWLVTWEEECFEKLLSDDEKENEEYAVEFNRDAILRVDYATRMAGMARMKEIGVLNSNQICAWENLPSQGAAGDRRYIPANWMPIGPDGLPVTAAPAAQATAASPTSQTTAAHRAMILDRAQQLLRFECRAIQRAAEKEKNFLDWMDGFYAQHQRKIEEALRPAIAALYSLAGRGGADLAAHQVAAVHCEMARAELLELTDSTSQAELPAAVVKLLDGWRFHADGLTDWIMNH